jgi:hypothetical protein
MTVIGCDNGTTNNNETFITSEEFLAELGLQSLDVPPPSDILIAHGLTAEQFGETKDIIEGYQGWDVKGEGEATHLLLVWSGRSVDDYIIVRNYLGENIGEITGGGDEGGLYNYESKPVGGTGTYYSITFAGKNVTMEGMSFPAGIMLVAFEKWGD